MVNQVDAAQVALPVDLEDGPPVPGDAPVAGAGAPVAGSSAVLGNVPVAGVGAPLAGTSAPVPDAPVAEAAVSLQPAAIPEIRLPAHHDLLALEEGEFLPDYDEVDEDDLLRSPPSSPGALDSAAAV